MFIASQTKKVAALDDMSAFPELVAEKPNQNEIPQLDFKAKLETVQSVEVKEIPVVKKKQKRGATPYEIMEELTQRYDQWKADFIEDYGEDCYERNYRFPNYDYEYVDRMDEKYERELAEEEEKERLRDLEDDFVTESYEEYEKE